MNANADRLLRPVEAAHGHEEQGERMLRSKPERVGLGKYINGMDRTNQALRELKATNLRTNQQAISDLSNLLTVGTQNLQEVFKEMCH